MTFNSFAPPERILLGPGPSNVNPRVLEAMAKLPLGHLDPRFIELMDEIKELLKLTFKTSSDATFVLSGPGSLGMEASLVNMIEPGEKIVVCSGGYFANRMIQIAEKIGANVVKVEEEWGRAFDPQKLDEALKQNPDAKYVAFVHAETSTGALSDIKTLAEIANKHECMTIVDAVTSLGTTELRAEEWNLDVVYSCSQKGLACVAGMSPLTFSERAVEHIRNRKTPIRSWFNDLELLLSYWSGGAKRAYHHTAPSNQFYGIHEALRIIHEEGIENTWDRHHRNSVKLIDELEKIGLNPIVPEGERIPNLITVKLPDGVNDPDIRSRLLNEFNLEIGGGLGDFAGKIWRIGLMGYASKEENIEYCINAFKKVL